MVKESARPGPVTVTEPITPLPSLGPLPPHERPTGPGSPELTAREKSKLRQQDKIKRRQHDADMETKRIQEKLLPLIFTIDTLRSEIVGKQLMRDLSLYVPFLISFVFFFFAGRDVEQAYFSVAGVKQMLIKEYVPAAVFNPDAVPGSGPKWKKQLKDVANSGDFYEWLEGVVIQQMWDRNNPNRTRNVTRTSGQNIALGSLRLRQLKVHDHSCDVNSNFYPDDQQVVPRVCYGRFSEANADTVPFGANGIIFNYTNGCAHHGQAVVGEIERYPCGGYIRDIPFSASYNQAIRWANELRLGNFVTDNSVRFLLLEFFTYNPSLDAFTVNRIFIEITAGGGWLPSNRFRYFAVFTENNGRVAYELYFLLFVLYYWGKFFTEWKRSGKGLRFVFTLWNFLEVINLSAFLVVFISRWVWWRASEGETWTLPYKEAFPETLDYVQNMYQIQVYFNSLNCVITFLKLLKFVQLNDRLNILTRTLDNCSQNIIGVLIIFVLVVFAYSITGCTLFGGGLADFRNISTSFSTCMRIVIGQFDYPAMKAENRSVAFIYFWTFVVLANFVLLNFVIAIISMGFEEESGKTKAVPLDVYLARWGKDTARFFTSIKDAWNAVYNAVIARTRRLPEVTLLDSLERWRNARLEELEITEDMITNEIVAEPNIMFGRQYFKKIMPLTELEYVTDRLLDELWEDLVLEYELANKLLQDQQQEKRVATHRGVCIRAVTDTVLARDSKNDRFMSAPKIQDMEEKSVSLAGQVDSAKRLMGVMVTKATALHHIGVKKPGTK